MLCRWTELLQPFLSTAVPSSSESDADEGPSTRPASRATKKKKKKKRRKPASTLPLPWKTTAQGARDTEAVLRGMVRDGAAPSGIAESNMHYCLTHPSYLKTHEWFVLAGPIGKLALLDRVDSEQYQAISKFFDVCCKLWSKEIPVSSDGSMADLRQAVAEAVASLEVVMPAWEMDIMWHLLLHLVDRMELLGPCWAFSMFSFERTWGQLDKWRSQQRHMEACIMNAFRAYRTAVIAMEQIAASAQQAHTGSSSSDDEGDEAADAHTNLADLSTDRLYDAALELPREIVQRKLPIYATSGREMHVWLYDQAKTLYFDAAPSAEADWWRVELHRYYFTKHHSTYGQVFKSFSVEHAHGCHQVHSLTSCHLRCC